VSRDAVGEALDLPAVFRGVVPDFMSVLPAAAFFVFGRVGVFDGRRVGFLVIAECAFRVRWRRFSIRVVLGFSRLS